MTTCPVASTFFQLMREKLATSRLLYEDKLDELGFLQQAMVNEPRPTKESTGARVGFCLAVGVQETWSRSRFELRPTAQTDFAKAVSDGTPLKYRLENLAIIQDQLRELGDANEAGAGELGLMGLQKGTRFMQHEAYGKTATAAELCLELSAVFEKMEEPSRAAVLLFSILENLNINIDKVFEYAKGLLSAGQRTFLPDDDPRKTQTVRT